jgi:hypothetical protein
MSKLSTADKYDLCFLIPILPCEKLFNFEVTPASFADIDTLTAAHNN